MDAVHILHGNTFVISDGRGDIAPMDTEPIGLFSFDTRFLSTWQLRINGGQLQALSVDDLQHYENRFFLVPAGATHYVDAKLSVIRQRYVGKSFFQEQLTVLNHDQRPAELGVRLEAGSDFIDLLDIRTGRQREGRYYTRVQDGSLCLGYRRGMFQRETIISTTTPARFDEHGLTFTARIEPHQRWVADLRVETVVVGAGGRDFRETLPGFKERSKAQIKRILDDWLDQRPQIETDSKSVKSTYRRSLIDLASLQFSPMTIPGQSLPAGGLPWFMTLTGRDSIMTSLQALPFAPELAATTLRMMGIVQGSQLDDFRDEEPGKIMREFRYGETAAFEERPQSPYFGAADTTPLYLILLDEYERWTGDRDLVLEYEEEARAALRWLDEYADIMGNGYVWYKSRNERTGLENQCWKESPGAISYRDGRLPGLPRATCELQGYAYDARMRAARLAREVWNDPSFADGLEREAADLKLRFNRDFWVDDGQYYALALDADGRQVDALASNMGHLLWSGIVDESRAKRTADHLVGPRLFSGWGVRTLADDQVRFNPLGYHVGAVWPFDNSFIAWGLWRYGFRDEAALITQAIFDAANFFQGRLPEAFGGYPRALTKYPVPYPSASDPQAWSTAAPLLLLRVIMGMQPFANHLMVDPAIPAGFGRVELLDVPGRWGRIDAFGRGRVDVYQNPQLRGEM